MATESKNDSGTSEGSGLRKRDGYKVAVIIAFIVIVILWGVKLGWFYNNPNTNLPPSGSWTRTNTVTCSQVLFNIVFDGDELAGEYTVKPADGEVVNGRFSGKTYDGGLNYMVESRLGRDTPIKSSMAFTKTASGWLGVHSIPDINGGLTKGTLVQGARPLKPGECKPLE